MTAWRFARNCVGGDLERKLLILQALAGNWKVLDLIRNMSQTAIAVVRQLGFAKIRLEAES
jgi:hypothetical protein